MGSKLWYNHHTNMKILHKRAGKRKMTKKTVKGPVRKKAHRRISAVQREPDKTKPTVKAGFHKPGEKSKGQSALATAVAEGGHEERPRLVGKSPQGDQGAVPKTFGV